ncbi:hypothetical protein ACFFSY_34670 [Paenibacillus aurantiacus]|uniref:DUF3888 domain-containing protein n=1 Tax=Paenibacillus aurantiacus TaxID=1936118 RepID=A0ABV5L0V0_9BACL
MSSKMSAACLALLTAAVLVHSPCAGATPREQSLESALLQQLDPVVRTAIGRIYRETYPQYGCERIVAINERVTTKQHRQPSLPVDAVHGARYYDITVRVCRPQGEQLDLRLWNDTVTAQYYLTCYRQVPEAELRAELKTSKPD